MKKRNIVYLSLAMALVGCGGSGSTSTTATPVTPKVVTGTAYYVDSAVAGVEYVCGSKSGTTGLDGKFTFEQGKDCIFSLAGVSLRTTKANELIDGKTIVENNTTVATFLQSIDADGNVSNGITIDDSVRTALKEALSTYSNKDDVLNDSAVLTNVISAIKNKVPTFKGKVKTAQEVVSHLKQTQTAITNSLLNGKTFYRHNFQYNLVKAVYNQDATEYKMYDLNGTLSITSTVSVDGDRVIGLFEALRNDSSYSIISQENGYIYLDNRTSDGKKSGLGIRLYASQADAKAYRDSTKKEITSSLVVGKTTYDDNTFKSKGITYTAYAKMLYTATTITRTETAYDSKGVISQENSFPATSFPYKIVNGQLILDLGDNKTSIMTATKITNSMFVVDMPSFSSDGNYTRVSTSTYYFTKPISYPSSF